MNNRDLEVAAVADTDSARHESIEYTENDIATTSDKEGKSVHVQDAVGSHVGFGLCRRNAGGRV